MSDDVEPTPVQKHFRAVVGAKKHADEMRKIAERASGGQEVDMSVIIDPDSVPTDLSKYNKVRGTPFLSPRATPEEIKEFEKAKKR